MERFLLLLFLVSSGFCLERQDLGGKWTVTSSDPEIKADAVVPGGIYTDLMREGIIGDIFAEYGDDNYSWVGLVDWTYSTEFTVNSNTTENYENINLVFDGLDTFATILVNGKEVGQSSNMFVRYVFNVKDVIQSGTNQLEVRFASPVTTAAAFNEEQEKNYSIPMQCPADEYNGVCYVSQIRKTQSSFSWDWGPSFPSSGIWKPVYLEAFNTVVIRNVLATVTKEESNFRIKLTTYFGVGPDAGDDVGGTVGISLKLKNGILRQEHLVKTTFAEDDEASSTYYIVINEDAIEKWWPNGYGAQSLYTLNVTYTNGDDEDETSLKIGFRTIELIQDEIDTGLTFYFKVNDVPIFAKGANEIPIDILPEKGQDRATIQRVLQNARDTNMNMIRVWGGGVYESDYFYELADEYGLLIWQDFMFACYMYPTRAGFLKTVIDEVNYQTKRLGSHPSIAIWSGNNENEGILASNLGNEGWTDQIKADYIELYVNTVKVEMKKVLPDAIFITSSPSNGIETENEGYVAKNPGDPNYGDVHYYNYDQDSWNYQVFPIPRFSSEFGYQSMPDLDAWKTVTNNTENLHPLSDFMKKRQHHPNGNNENINLIENQLTLPDSSSDNYINAFIFYSQVVQAQSVKTETEHYRSFTGRYDDEGRGNTMGALFWQLNDVWVGPTWSGVDYLGKWKMLQYFAKNFFAPIIVTSKINGEELEIYVVVDKFDNSVELQVVLHVFKWDSLDHQLMLPIPVNITEGQSVEAAKLDLRNVLFLADCGSFEDGLKDCFLHFHVMDEEGVEYAPANYNFPSKLKDSNVGLASLTVSSIDQVADDSKAFDITINTNMPALFVWLDMHDIRGRFSDNGFVQVSASKVVRFIAEEETTLEAVTSALTVVHLKDSSFL